MKIVIAFAFSFCSFCLFGQTNLYCNVYGNATTQAEKDSTAYYLDGSMQEYNGCDSMPALHVVVIDSLTCEPWGTYYSGQNPNNRFGNENDDGGCRPRVEKFFVYKQDNVAQIDSFEALIQNFVPFGAYLLIYSWQYMDFTNWGASTFIPLNNLGFSGIMTAPDSVPCILFVRHGMPATAIELYGTTINDTLELNTVLNCLYDGIKENREPEEIVIYPNPATNQFNISGIVEYPAEISLYDLTGSQVLSRIIYNNEPVQVNNFPPGLYLYQVKTPDVLVRGKLVKQ